MDPARRIPEIEEDSDVFDLVNRHGSDDLAPGARVSENLRLIALLGAGGMGDVWLAEHLGLGTRVAVKFMTNEVAADAACVARFGTEAKLAARIKSPHVVTILDYATTTRGVPYIVMELLEGEDLESRIRDDRKLGLEDSSRVLIQICKALSKAHALGIVHRDIKPDNVFLAEHEGEIFVKVLDFGIAKDEEKEQGITASGTTMGTPSFMSPEQLFRPNDVDLRSDLWSTAVVAYRCLTGTLPFEGDNFGAMCISVHDGAFVPPSSLDPSLPPELDEWFEKALALDANDRFASASEMANAYLAVLDHARLLPRWAAANSRASYSSDPGGISGGPVVVRRRPRTDVRAIVIGLVVTVACILWATPERNALFAVVARWIEAAPQVFPRLNPTPVEPRLDLHDPFPSYPRPASRPALAPREPERELPPAPPRIRIPYDEPFPDLRRPSPAPSYQFGI
jgi:serine/threonine-protein kinase